MIRVLSLIAFLCATPALAQQVPAGLDPQNTIYLETPHGRVVIKLRTDLAPQHAERIKTLAREKYYDNVPFNRGIVGMARAQNPNSANSQFFIMFAETPSLNGQYTVVGEVASGMEAVDKIKKGSQAQNGAVTEPDRIVRMQDAADAR